MSVRLSRRVRVGRDDLGPRVSVSGPGGSAEIHARSWWSLTRWGVGGAPAPVGHPPPEAAAVSDGGITTGVTPKAPTSTDTVFKRDASWYPRPSIDRRRPPKWHFPHPDDPGVSACGRVGLDENTHSPAVSVHLDDVCRLHGCREGREQHRPPRA